MFGDGDNVGPGNFGDGDTTISLVGGVKVDVIGSDTRCDSNLELLGFGETLCGEVTWVESFVVVSCITWIGNLEKLTEW